MHVVWSIMPLAKHAMTLRDHWALDIGHRDSSAGSAWRPSI